MVSRMLHFSRSLMKPKIGGRLFPMIRRLNTDDLSPPTISATRPVPNVAIRGKRRRVKPKLSIDTETFTLKSKDLFKVIDEGLQDMIEADPGKFTVDTADNNIQIWAVNL